MLSTTVTDLRAVRAITIPLPAVASLLFIVLRALPALRSLSVLAKAESKSNARNEPLWDRFPWGMLPDLLIAKRLCRGLKEIELEVTGGDDDAPLTSEDADELLAQLEPLGRRGLSDVDVKGFPTEIVLGLDVRRVLPYGIQFTVL